jgi:CubicO group peptidase (beta-lactamase class C family)
VICLLVLVGGGCKHIDEAPLSALQSKIDDEIAEGEVPSIVAAVIHEQRVTMLDPAGTQSLQAPISPDRETVYMWFSISKLFTATAVMQLHEKGLIDIDEPARKYVPELAALEEFPGDPITVRHLLNHSSGLANPKPYAWARPDDEPRPSSSALLERLIAAHPKPSHRPGRRWRYNNMAYLVLGQLVEHVSGEAYADYLQEHIFDPLGMTRTGVAFAEADLTTNVATGYVDPSSPLYRRVRDEVAPSIWGPPHGDYISFRRYKVDGIAYGGIVGSVEDLAKFVSAHLNDGEHQGARILRPETARAMREAQHTKGGRRLRHCLGWHSDTIDGERYYNHMGLGGGFRPAVRIYPERRYGIVVLTNRTIYQPKPLTRTVVPAGP